MKHFIILLTLLLLCSVPIYSQWGVQGCYATQVSVDTKPSWHNLNDRPNHIFLYEGNNCIGAWNYAGQFWQDYNHKTGEWGKKTDIPRIEPPEHPQFPRLYFGVVARKEPYGCSRKGTKISVEEAISSLSDKVTDDSQKFRLTIICDDKNTRDDLYNKYLKFDNDLLKRINIWKVNRNHWVLRDNDTNKAVFDITTPLNIYFTANDGEVLHRQTDFDGEPSFVALRKAIKNYDKEKDPDLRKPEPIKPEPKKPNPEPQPQPKPNSTQMPTWLWLIMLIGGGVMAWNHKEWIINILNQLPQSKKQ